MAWFSVDLETYPLEMIAEFFGVVISVFPGSKVFELHKRGARFAKIMPAKNEHGIHKIYFERIEDVFPCGWQSIWLKQMAMEGDSLVEQLIAHETRFAPWPLSGSQNEIGRLTFENPHFYLRLLENETDAIRRSEAVEELQRVLIIPGVNDFLLRDRPTPGDFDLILADHYLWTLKPEAYIQDVSEREKIRSRLGEVTELARNRFVQLRL